MEWIEALRGSTVGLDTGRSRPELAEEYRNILLQSPALSAIPLDEGIAEEAAAY